MIEHDARLVRRRLGLGDRFNLNFFVVWIMQTICLSETEDA